MAELLSGAFNFIPIIGAILLFVAVVLIVVGVGAMLQEFEFMQRRLAGPRSPVQEETGTTRSILIEDNLLKRIDNFVTPKNLDELSKIRKRLVQAGYRKPSAVRVFYLSKAVLALGFV